MKTDIIFIDPFTDYGFKRIFAWEANTDLLIDFLNTVLEPGNRIVSLAYLNAEKAGEIKTDHNAVFDIRCEDETGNQFVIELQRIKDAFIRDRSLFYGTIPIRMQAKKGEWNIQLKQTLVICIMNFVFGDSDPGDMIHEVTLTEKRRGKVFNENLVFWYFEMPKFKKKINELASRQDHWFFILNNLSSLQKIPLTLKFDPIFNKLFMEAKISNYSEEDAMAYYASMKERRDNFAIRETAMMEGEEKGRLEGEARGRTEGAEEVKFAIALQMKLLGEPIDKIMQLTGLRALQVEELHV